MLFAGPVCLRLLQCTAMTDWRQIQARIRKAKASADAPGQLAQLYERTRDAMVAFELAQLHETSGNNAEAARWYTAAAERFRRAQWKTKAEEALARLGAPMPAPAAAQVEAAQAPPAPPEVFTTGESVERSAEFFEPAAKQPARPLEPAAEPSGGTAAPERPRHRRRGRRGGRGRRRGQREQTQLVPAVVRAQPSRPQIIEEPPEERMARAPSPPRPAEQAAGPAAWRERGRAGEPALASRLAHLESQLRRLLASPLYRLDDADQAPAGPGVFILSDSDQTTYYYIESCQTLRVGVGNLLRGERGGSARKGGSLRARFADNLGISESRVSKYLKEYCAVRWLQLDEGAALLAHFAIAVLRPALNE